ncbi:hypothetical protein PIB30_048686 [Stylosanthes scabra]|uniref:Uncharacterized protein n=1 Tax=Stylosanthes scabra TaxID=79078 RepID=A0ABU6RH62_9FABA|nr:hypothetical protein [Stylosanthes scabra]
MENHVATELEAMLKKAQSLFTTQTCCIYKVPHSIRQLNEDAYTPVLVSIGPLHHGNSRLVTMEVHKQVYCQHLIERSEASLTDLVSCVQQLEPQIRACYSEKIDLTVTTRNTLVTVGFSIGKNPTLFPSDFVSTFSSDSFNREFDEIFSIGFKNPTQSSTKTNPTETFKYLSTTQPPSHSQSRLSLSSNLPQNPSRPHHCRGPIKEPTIAGSLTPPRCRRPLRTARCVHVLPVEEEREGAVVIASPPPPPLAVAVPPLDRSFVLHHHCHPRRHSPPPSLALSEPPYRRCWHSSRVVSDGCPGSTTSIVDVR